jgi:hypothetical protein
MTWRQYSAMLRVVRRRQASKNQTRVRSSLKPHTEEQSLAGEREKACENRVRKMDYLWTQKGSCKQTEADPMLMQTQPRPFQATHLYTGREQD